MYVYTCTRKVMQVQNSYVAEHHCEKAGCGVAFILDGNMKNHRYVCSATHAGYAEFKGLDGNIITGCPKTPALKSSYCSAHTPIIAVRHNNTECHDSNTEAASTTSPPEEQPIGMIVDKRVTRNSTLYQVCMYP